MGASAEMTSQTFVKTPRVVEKALQLPLVTDTCTFLAATSAPLQPILAKTMGSLSPVVEQGYSTLLAGVTDIVPAAVSTRITAAKDQVAAAVEVVDSSLCSGLDQLVTAVPSLAAPTPSLLTSATAAANTLASFTLGQLALKAADSGLETAGGLLKLGPTGKVEAVVEGLARASGEVAKIDGYEKVK